MEPYWKALLHSLLSSIGGLMLGCLVICVLVSPILLGPELGWSIVQMAKAAVLGLLISFFAMLFGILPALLWVAPVYAWLRRGGYANVLTAAVLGAIPGLMILTANREWGLAFLTYGIGCTLCTHLLASRWRWPGHSPGAMVSRA